MVLACLERMVLAFGRALLLPNGNLESTFNFSTPNTSQLIVLLPMQANSTLFLGLSLYLSNSTDKYYQSPTTSGNHSQFTIITKLHHYTTEGATIRIPTSQLCRRRMKKKKFEKYAHRCNNYTVDAGENHPSIPFCILLCAFDFSYCTIIIKYTKCI